MCIYRGSQSNRFEHRFSSLNLMWLKEENAVKGLSQLSAARDFWGNCRTRIWSRGAILRALSWPGTMMGSGSLKIQMLGPKVTDSDRLCSPSRWRIGDWEPRGSGQCRETQESSHEPAPQEGWAGTASVSQGGHWGPGAPPGSRLAHQSLTGRLYRSRFYKTKRRSPGHLLSSRPMS